MVMRIKELRENAGIRQKDLAEQLGVVQACVANWENEVYLPRTRQLPALASALGCSINELFSSYPNSSLAKKEAIVYAE